MPKTHRPPNTHNVPLVGQLEIVEADEGARRPLRGPGFEVRGRPVGLGVGLALPLHAF